MVNFHAPIGTHPIPWDLFEANVLKFRTWPSKRIYVIDRSISWHHKLFQRPQYMALALARAGNLVIFVSTEVADRTHEGVYQVAENVWISGSLRAYEIPNAVIVSFSTAQTLPPRRLDCDQVLVYDYIDHIDPLISGSDSVRPLQKKLEYAKRGHFDVLVASAKSLQVELQETGRKVSLIQNGVDFGAIQDLRTQVLEGHPLGVWASKYGQVIGYFGAMAPWIWFELVNELTLSNPDIGFVFIGPDYGGALKGLVRRENVFWMDAVPAQELPRLSAVFDIAWIPFRLGKLAESTSPLKLFEYFALELPVLVTPDLRECLAFSEAVFPFQTGVEFERAIEQARLFKRDGGSNELLRLAQENSWDNRAAILVSRIEELAID